MITGQHIVRDVFCKNCNFKLGWMYEFAHDPQQSYKEGIQLCFHRIKFTLSLLLTGRVILERKLLDEKEETDPNLAGTTSNHIFFI